VLGWVVLGSFGLSGFASLIYENAWTRALSLVIAAPSIPSRPCW